MVLYHRDQGERRRSDQHDPEPVGGEPGEEAGNELGVKEEIGRRSTDDGSDSCSHQGGETDCGYVLAANDPPCLRQVGGDDCASDGRFGGVGECCAEGVCGQLVFPVGRAERIVPIATPTITAARCSCLTLATTAAAIPAAGQNVNTPPACDPIARPARTAPK